MVKLEDDIYKKIQNYLRLHPKIEKATIFGSRAKGNARRGSDIDIAISGKDLRFIDLCEIKSDIEELNLPYSVDIINYDNISNVALKEHIDRVGKDILLIPSSNEK